MKGDFALKHIGQQQGLVVSRNAVDEEIMALQKGALQRGEKFKESEVRPKVHSPLPPLPTSLSLPPFRT